jgi:MFS family permease
MPRIPSLPTSHAARNIAIYPWFRFCQSLIFWQAVWFLYFQAELSATEAILLYAIYDVGTTALEVPSGYMSDRLGRRFTLLASAVAGLVGAVLLALGNDFATFALAQILMGASMAFASGTDSAMLYESLVAAGRKSEVEQQELRAWRFSFTALALSAITGGAMAMLAPSAPFYAGALAFGGVLVLALRFYEPPKSGAPLPEGAEVLRLQALKSALTQPVLIWLFALSVLMYGFSHLPFVFGQPFILAALNDGGHGANAPMVSGAVSAVMMVISVPLAWSTCDPDGGFHDADCPDRYSGAQQLHYRDRDHVLADGAGFPLETFHRCAGSARIAGRQPRHLPVITELLRAARLCCNALPRLLRHRRRGPDALRRYPAYPGVLRSRRAGCPDRPDHRGPAPADRCPTACFFWLKISGLMYQAHQQSNL